MASRASAGPSLAAACGASPPSVLAVSTSRRVRSQPRVSKSPAPCSRRRPCVRSRRCRRRRRHCAPWRPPSHGRRIGESLELEYISARHACVERAGIHGPWPRDRQNRVFKPGILNPGTQDVRGGFHEASPLPGESLMTKMLLKPRGEINHIFVVNFLGKFSSIDAVETPRMPMP